MNLTLLFLLLTFFGSFLTDKQLILANTQPINLSTINVNNLEQINSKKLEEADSQKELFDFVFNDDEISEVCKWKEKSLEDVWDDALKCDRAALYNIGMYFLTGITGLTIDSDKADFFFSRSASLGFAPSIKQLIHKNIENENPFLVMVYCNILTTLGHHECVIPYHEYRNKMLNTFGKDVCRSINEAASNKQKLILSNIHILQSTENKENLLWEIFTKETLIDGEDKEFNNDYWIQFSKFQSEADNLTNRFEHILGNDFQEFTVFYEKSRINMSKALQLLKNNQSIEAVRISALKDAYKAIQKTEECKVQIKEFQKSSNDNLRKLAKEFYLLLQAAQDVLQQHHSFFLSHEKFLDSESALDKLTEFTARANAHVENIEHLLQSLKKYP